jgi:hypothetical protein
MVGADDPATSPRETGSSGRAIFARICNSVPVIFSALLVADEVIE